MIAKIMKEEKELREKMNGLQKLRLIVTSIFVISTLGMVLIVPNINVGAGVVLLILSYLLLIVLTIKLYLVKSI